VAQAAEGSVNQLVGESKADEPDDALDPFVVAVECTRMPMVFMDAMKSGNPIIFANDSFIALFRCARSEILGLDFQALMERGTDPDAQSQVKAAFENTSDKDPEISYRRNDGSQFWASIFITPVRDRNGSVVQHFASLVDITAHKGEQTQANSLIDELNHRVKNTLSTVQSIVVQALRSSSNPTVVGESILSRIFALSKSHDLLTSESWQSVGLLEVVNGAMEPFGIENGRAKCFGIEGENIRLTPKAAVALGITFHELATNAVKYGALRNEHGCVEISWEVEAASAGDLLVLHWRERGGPLVTPPSRKGFGSRVIERGLAHELGGEVRLDYAPTGVICTIAIPAPRATGDA
jgi:PAS domain S-box-containing protein